MFGAQTKQKSCIESISLHRRFHRRRRFPSTFAVKIILYDEFTHEFVMAYIKVALDFLGIDSFEELAEMPDETAKELCRSVQKNVCICLLYTTGKKFVISNRPLKPFKVPGKKLYQ